MLRKMYIILCLLFIINSCRDNSTTPIYKDGYWTVSKYIMIYDKVNQKWDSSSKIVKEINKYDGKIYFPEGDYKTMYGKNYWNHDYLYIFKKNFGNLLEEYYKNPFRLSLTHKYHYDEKGYLSKIVLYNYNNEVIDSTEYINENGKLIERRDIISNNYSKYEYGTNNFINMIKYYNSNNELTSYHEYKYDNNDYIIEMSGAYIDSYGMKISYSKKYVYNNSGYLIEFIEGNQKGICKYNSNNLLIEIETEFYKCIYKYDKNNYLKEMIYYDKNNKLDYKCIYENLHLIAE